MAIQLAARDRSETKKVRSSWLRDVFAGSICGVLSIAFGLSYAVLIFSGPLAPWLSYGVAATFASTGIAALVVALRGSLPFAISGPDSSTSAVTAVLAAALAERLVAEGAGNQLLMPTLIVMAIGSALTGILLCGLGLARAGRAIRFVPYPVIGGFLGATGWLVVSGAVLVVTDLQLSVHNLEALFSASSIAKLLAGVAVTTALFVARTWYRSPLVLPVLLLASFVTVYLAILLSGLPLSTVQTAGWMFRPQAATTFSLPWRFDALSGFPWAALPSLSGELMAVMFVTAISLLLNMTGIEIATRHEADLNRDLNALGAANILSAAFGGYVSCVSLLRSTLNYSAGATGRLAGVTMAAIASAMLLVDPDFLAYVPKCVLAGLLLYLGLDLMYRWLVDSARRLSRIEYASLLAIALIIVNWGFIAGVLIGVVIGCAAFALSASQVNVIKFHFDASEYRSSLDRDPAEHALLGTYGRELQGMSLQSYLFFGSANRLYEHVKGLLAAYHDCRFLVFDFRLVTGIDSSSMYSFTQIKQAADSARVRLVLVNLTPEMDKAFRNIRFITDDIQVSNDLDHALEDCENAIIEAHRVDDNESRTINGWLTEALGEQHHADNLARHFRRVKIDAGQIIARQGDAAGSMLFIAEGRIGVLVDAGDGRVVRVRSVGRHTTIGEMGLITRQPRSATLETEVESVLYELSADAYERLKTDNSALTHALHTYIIRVMAERIGFASRVISALQR